MKKCAVLITAIVLVLLAGSALADLDIHFLDVGQGDAALIICDGEAALIDTGPAYESEFIYSYLRQLPVRKLRFLLLTHPHDDHVAGASAALNAVPVEDVLSPVASWDTKLFKNIVKYAYAQGTAIHVVSEGDIINLGSATLTVLHAWPEAWDENDMSIVFRLEYGSFSAIFTGDAEYMSEYMILDKYRNLHSDLIKIGHHGSSSSSTMEFLRAVSPKYAVISCKTGNDYGHPHQEVLDRLKTLNVDTYRTDLHGDIFFHVSPDGAVNITTTRSAENKQAVFSAPEIISDVTRAMDPNSTYVLNVKSKKFHLPDCDSVDDIYFMNRKEYTGTRSDLIEMGYMPCRRCNP